MTPSCPSPDIKGFLMMNFGRRDRFTEGKSIDKSALKPALYDPPTAAGRGTNVPARTAAAACCTPLPGRAAAPAYGRGVA